MNSDQVFDGEETKKKRAKVRVNCFYEKECYKEYKEGVKNLHIDNVVGKQAIVSSHITSNLNDEVQRHKRHFVKKFLISCFGLNFDDEGNKSLKNKLPNFCFSQPENNVPDIVTETILSEDFVNIEPLSKSPFNKSSRTKSLASTDSSDDSADIVKTCPNETASGRDFVNIILLRKSPVQRSSRIKSSASTDAVVTSVDISKTSSINLDSDVSELKKGVAKPLDKPEFIPKKKNCSHLKSSEQSSFSKKFIETQRYDPVIQLMARDGSLRLYSTRTLAPLDYSAIYDDKKIAKHLNLTYRKREISYDSESASSKEFSSGSDNVFTEDNIPNATTGGTQSLETKELIPVTNSSFMNEKFGDPSRTFSVRQTDIDGKPIKRSIEREVSPGDGYFKEIPIAQNYFPCTLEEVNAQINYQSNIEKETNPKSSYKEMAKIRNFGAEKIRLDSTDGFTEVSLTQETSLMKSNGQKNFRKRLQAFSSENQSSLYSEAIHNEKESHNIYKQTPNLQSFLESTEAGFDANAERYIENSYGLSFGQTFSKGVYGSFFLANTYNNLNTTPNINLPAFSTTQHGNVDETLHFKTQFPEVKQISPLVNETQECRQSSSSINKDSFEYLNHHAKSHPFKPIKSIFSDKVKDFTQQEPNKDITTKDAQQTRHRSLSAYPRKGRHLASLDPEGPCDQRNVFRNISQTQRSASFGDDTVLTYYQFIDGPLANKLRPYSVRAGMRPTGN